MNTVALRNLLAALLSLSALAGAWALGDPEAGDYQPVQGLENWDAQLDITGRKAGKYNLVVRGTDVAGNVRYEGPFNVFVDPASDLPVVHISHPTPGARVGTFLHVVGTCVDDDGVRSVRVRLDDGEPVEAEGTAFWSYALDVEAVPDGEHLVTVVGVDQNGTEGRPQSVRFQIDKRAPYVAIASHPSGSLVTGQVSLTGEIEDANGVASLAMSQDGGKTWQTLRTDMDKPARKGTFRVSLDTRKIPDGPLVLSLKASDRTGSVGQYAFLLFVNNDAPVLEVLSPSDETVVNGKVLVSGRASDKIGLKSLRYDLGGAEAGTIDLTPGNPFWTQEIDLTENKAGAFQISYVLENLAGNKATRKLRLRVEPEGDRPRLTVSSPEKGASLAGAVSVVGFAVDDDGVDHVEYSLDGGAPQTVTTQSAFSFSLPDLPAGAHKLVLKAVDIGGVAGTSTEVSFVSVPQPPTVSLGSIVAATGAVPFSPGMVLASDKEVRIAGTIRFSGTAVRAEYSLQGAESKSLPLKTAEATDQRLFEIPVRRGLPAGRADLTIRATDGFGGIAVHRSFVFIGAEQGASGIILLDSRLTDGGSIRLDGPPLEGYATGGAIQKAVLDPPTDLVRVDVEGPLFRVTAAGAGVTAPTRVRVTAGDGSGIATEPMVFITDFVPPGITVSRTPAGDWVRGDLTLEVVISDAVGVALLEYSLDGGSFAPLETASGGEGATSAATVPLQALAEGPHVLVLRALDTSGNATSTSLPFVKDTVPPEVVFVAPRTGDEVNGLVTVVGHAVDAGRVGLVEVTEDGTSYREVATDAAFRFDVNLSQLGEDAATLMVRCTDMAGNVTEARPKLSLNLSADIPVAQIQLPADGELLRDDFVLSGMVFDDDGVQAIYYRIDDGQFERLAGGNNFSVRLLIDQIEDNEHTVEVKAEDIGGLMSEVATSRFKVSRTDPLSSLTSPGISEHLRGVVDLQGTSKDPNGIAEVRVSFDNGLSFCLAEGAESWRYRLDTRLLADGVQAVLIRATDTTGAEGLYSTTMNVDNLPPDLVVDTPFDGQIFTDSLRLDGRSLDNIGLATLTVSVAPISEAPGVKPRIIEATLTPGGILSQSFDLRDLPAGWYNVQVEAADRAGNRSYVSRNFRKRVSEEAERVDVFFPSAGERLAGPFTVSGQAVTRTASAGKNALVMMDGQPLDTTDMDAAGYFSLEVDPSSLAAGDHALTVEVVLDGGARLLSESRGFQYSTDGPWVLITSSAPGDYVTGRPFLSGKAGWHGEETDAVDDATRPSKPDAGHRIRHVEVSTDNGTTFTRADGRDSWRFRLESQNIPNGVLRLLVRATFANGSTAVTRTQLVVDTRAPTVTLLEPEESGRFNEVVQVMGTASDEVGLKEVAVSLREGDKSRYQVPSFVQGLYLDAHTMGATYWDVGLGLTFFDANVKLQLQVGMSPPGRFSGFVIGGKLLANIATLPFSYILGPSWDFFSMSLAIGANFSYFTMSEDNIAFTGTGLVLGGIVGQVEFAKFRIPRWRVMNVWSLYSEYQLWFISSDVQGGTVSRIGFGMRVGLL